ncbi:MAG TPA: LLM class flavin-dependent oxidoreductase [Chloroflexota bacterium]|jgi:alkanesulfonate monooxygenase SsuD/methylene tetrahydromethanopterin reductase-like flavin-dependent oxidoreductase (luciferase family)
MAAPDLEASRRALNPLFNDNRIKLGVFALNVSSGCAITTAEGRLELTWPTVRAIARLADEAGFEAMVPVARWLGFGGPSNFNGDSYETYTWAAGLAEATEHLAVFSTSHVPTIHPIVAAKQATTIDHIAGGRFALNVVCGWYTPELEMFGAPIMEHETRYEYATEWLEVVKRLWTAEEPFDYEGRFFQIKRGTQQPKPIQQPFPAVMNAGSSGTGRRFAAKYADMVFTGLGRDGNDLKADVANYRRTAWDEFGRELQIWGHWSVICRPTEREARDYLRYYVYEKGDWEAASNLIAINQVQSGDGRWANRSPEELEAIKARYIAGWGGATLAGTPEMIVDRLIELADAGIDGVVLSWVNYEAELQEFAASVLPLVEQAGLRKPRPTALAGSTDAGTG